MSNEDWIQGERLCPRGFFLKKLLLLSSLFDSCNDFDDCNEIHEVFSFVYRANSLFTILMDLGYAVS